MTNSVLIFLFFASMLITTPCWFLGLKIARKRILQGKGDYPGFLVAFGGPILSLFVPALILTTLIIPNYGTVEIFAAQEIREDNNNGEITQYIVYENGTEYNLTLNTGKYYTELPDSEYKRETYTFLWVVNWDKRWVTGLDKVDRRR